MTIDCNLIQERNEIKNDSGRFESQQKTIEYNRQLLLFIFRNSQLNYCLVICLSNEPYIEYVQHGLVPCRNPS